MAHNTTAKKTNPSIRCARNPLIELSSPVSTATVNTTLASTENATSAATISVSVKPIKAGQYRRIARNEPVRMSPNDNGAKGTTSPVAPPRSREGGAGETATVTKAVCGSGAMRWRIRKLCTLGVHSTRFVRVCHSRPAQAPATISHPKFGSTSNSTTASARPNRAR
ncbi:hypothetical protein [Nocardia africana]|uniref:hypothetical protein n=1 Tax=Nocardia africana TaxID=134964 RepID=UPI000FE193AB|nr:hypothetical protein [Nocardia africana]